MNTASIPVDLFNPGQVFACLGFVEASLVLCGPTRAAFDWSDRSAVRFHIAADSEHSPITSVLGFLAGATVSTRAPSTSALSTTKWDIATDSTLPGAPFPFELPASPATLPAVLRGSSPAGRPAEIVIEYWGDRSRADNVKFWGGAAGMPGAALARDSIGAVRAQLVQAAADPFSLAAPQSNSFRFDWRRDYIPMDAGFSLNKHSNFTPVGYPLVELLAAIGVSHARPKPLHKLEYRYSVIGSATTVGAVMFEPILLRAALGSAALPFHRRTFHMHLGWPGKEGQSRAITTVTEEN